MNVAGENPPGGTGGPMPATVITVVPSRISDVHPAFRNSSVSLARRIDEFRPHTTTERLPVRRGPRRAPGDETRRRIKVLLFHRADPRYSSGKPTPGRKAAVAEWTSTPVAGSGEDVVTQCLKALSKLDTDCLLTVYALIAMAVENRGAVVDDIAALSRRRGWSPSSLDARSRPGMASRRERLREHLGLLTQIEFVITGLGEKQNRYVAFPLLRYMVRGGERAEGGGGREYVVYEFHPLLWRDMTEAGRALFYEAAFLHADAKRDEWAVRLLWYMGSRWGRNWVTKMLDQKGGRLTERVAALLNGADIHYSRQLSAQGRPWLRRSFRNAMDKLLAWRPSPLIGGYEIREHPTDPLEDRVTFRPTATVANRYNTARSKAIASRDRRLAWRAGGQVAGSASESLA
ncbi:MAG: hypothetical protein V2A79_18545 [Planctomycetota bacterium]